MFPTAAKIADKQMSTNVDAEQAMVTFERVHTSRRKDSRKTGSYLDHLSVRLVRLDVLYAESNTIMNDTAHLIIGHTRICRKMYILNRHKTSLDIPTTTGCLKRGTWHQTFYETKMLNNFALVSTIVGLLAPNHPAYSHHNLQNNCGGNCGGNCLHHCRNNCRHHLHESL